MVTWIKTIFALLILSLAVSAANAQSVLNQANANSIYRSLGGYAADKWFILPNDTLPELTTSLIRHGGLLAYKYPYVYQYDTVANSWVRIATDVDSSIFATVYDVDTAKVNIRNTYARPCNVLHYGVIPNDGLDDRDGIQDAIIAQFNGECDYVYFPAVTDSSSTNYDLYGAVETIAGYTNTNQVYFPYALDFSKRKTISLIGAIPPNMKRVEPDQQQYANTGVIIRSHLRGAATGSVKSIFGSLLQTSALAIRNPNNLYVENLTILAAPTDSTGAYGGNVHGINAFQMSSPSVIKNVIVGIDTPLTESLEPPTHENPVGVLLPCLGAFSNGDTITGSSVFENSYVYGYKVGMRISDGHISGVRFAGMTRGIMFNQRNNGNIIGEDLTFDFCKNSISTLPHKLNDESNRFHILGAHIRWARTGQWYDNEYVMWDSLELGRGIVYYNIDSAGIEDNSLFAQLGGDSVYCYASYPKFALFTDVNDSLNNKLTKGGDIEGVDLSAGTNDNFNFGIRTNNTIKWLFDTNGNLTAQGAYGINGTANSNLAIRKETATITTAQQLISIAPNYTINQSSGTINIVDIFPTAVTPTAGIVNSLRIPNTSNITGTANYSSIAISGTFTNGGTGTERGIFINMAAGSTPARYRGFETANLFTYGAEAYDVYLNSVGGKSYSRGKWIINSSSDADDGLGRMLQLTGRASISDSLIVGNVITTAGLDLYTSDLSGSYTARTKIDMGFAGATYAPISGSANYEVPLTFSTGLSRTANTITNNLSTGIAGGQTINGGTAANEDLTIQATTHATKTSANVVINPTGGNFGVGTTSPNIAGWGASIGLANASNVGFEWVRTSGTNADDVNIGAFKAYAAANGSNSIAQIAFNTVGTTQNSGKIRFSTWNGGVFADVLTLYNTKNSLFSGEVTSTGYNLSALQTPPASAGASGTTGTIIYGTDGYLYLCTATNTWVRVQLATW